MTCKSCGRPATDTLGPRRERICWPCATMLVGARVLAEELYGRPFFWDGIGDITRNDFLDDTMGRVWEALAAGRRWAEEAVHGGPFTEDSILEAAERMRKGDFFQMRWGK